MRLMFVHIWFKVEIGIEDVILSDMTTSSWPSMGIHMRRVFPLSQVFFLIWALLQAQLALCLCHDNGFVGFKLGPEPE